MSMGLTLALNAGLWLSLFTAPAVGAEAQKPSIDRQATEQTWKHEFDQEIERLRRRFKGRISVYVRDYNYGVGYSHDIDEPCYLASGVKLAFMLEVFRQEHQGLLSMDEELVFDETSIRDGAPRLNKREPGDKIKIRELLEMMIHASDNAASDMLVRRVGIHNVNAGLVAEGFTGFNRLTPLIDVRRGVFREVDVAADDLTPFEVRKIRWTRIWDPQVRELERAVGKPRNTYSKEDLISAYDRFYATGVNSARLASVGALLERLAKRTLVSPEASDRMMALLYGVRTGHHRIRAQLPKGTQVAHKTGSQFERICDLGLIGMPDDTQLVVVSCMAGGENRSIAEATLAGVARKAYDLAITLRKSRGS